MQTVSLNGDWQLCSSNGDDRAAANVPGGVYGDLLAAGEIDDPFEHDNELDVQWVGKTDWEYRRTVTVDEDVLDHERITLVCEGLDTVATVFVNDEVVGTSRNMHREYDFAVGDALERGENEVCVRFRSPVEYARERSEDHSYEVPALRYPVDHPHRNFIRKAQCHFGWDWGPCLPTMGIWRPIRLVAHSAPRITDVVPQQQHRETNGTRTVDLDIRVGLDVPSAGEYTVSAAVAGADAASARTVDLDLTDAADAGDDREAELSLAIEDPDLWWPAGRGEQSLYELDVTVEGEAGAHKTTERLGFREIELVREPDDASAVDGEGDSVDGGGEDGESFFLRVNGEAMFVRGSNWIPADALYRNVTDERYDNLLSDAVAANMNTIRVWGGGHYERKAFYRRCDELGLLVWQDFMFSCAQYPADEEFLSSVESEARYQVRRLSTHPSVALWCGNNELEVGVASWFADSEHSESFREDYEELFRERLATITAKEDPTRPYWSGSPSSGTDRMDPENERRGDIHYWGVWHEGKPFSAFRDTRPRFVSEFGYQSFPSVESLADVVPDDQHNPTAPLMEHHQRNPGGNKRILQRMADHFRMPDSFEEFTYLSQIQQGIAIKTAVEHWRRSKPYTMGAIYWQLNDLWQCASWSSIEYGGGWKALHHFARRFYAPVLVSIVENDETLELWITSDERDPRSGSIALEATTLDGRMLFEDRFEASVEGDESARIVTVDIEEAIDGAPRSDVLVRASPDGLGASSAFHALVPYKHLSLPKTTIETDVTDGAVRLEAPETALFVELRTAEDGRFANNYFDLAPGESRTIAFEPSDERSPPSDWELATDLSIRHLAETY